MPLRKSLCFHFFHKRDYNYVKAGLDPGWQGDPITPQNATMRINLLNVTNVITRPNEVTDIISQCTLAMLHFPQE